MNTPLTIALSGLGVVGSGVLQLLTHQAHLIEQRAGRPVRVVALSARDRTRDRGVDITAIPWYDDPVQMATEADAHVVVELIGGEQGTALDTVRAALNTGCHVVTANKAMLAHHGIALATLAEQQGRMLQFEAAVAGAIPIIKTLREGLAANGVTRVLGILNGTCNYILTSMEDTQRDFASILKHAQDLGYAEADPTTDIDGIDTAHKLAILASIAFGQQVSFDAVHCEGIRHISLRDIAFADELGFKIKLLGIAQQTDAGIEQRVHPCMIDKASILARIGGAFNAVEVECSHADTILNAGPGAGSAPTASAVVGDIIDIARNNTRPPFGVPCATLTKPTPVPAANQYGASYIRLDVTDKPGVLADITATLSDKNISIERVIQHEHHDDRDAHEAVSIVLVTHECNQHELRKALVRIHALECVLSDPMVVRIEALPR